MKGKETMVYTAYSENGLKENEVKFTTSSPSRWEFYMIGKDSLSWLSHIPGNNHLKIWLRLLSFMQKDCGEIIVDKNVRKSLMEEFGLSKAGLSKILSVLLEAGAMKRKEYIDKKTGELTVDKSVFEVEASMAWNGSLYRRALKDASQHNAGKDFIADVKETILSSIE